MDIKISWDKILNVLLVVLVLAFIGKKLYLMPKQKSGEAAINFEAVLIGGSSFSLADQRGNYVLLDFWASWCGPCRKENPELVVLWNSFYGKSFSDAAGFKIVSIGLENNKQKWQNAIVKDQLSWPYHIFQENAFESPLAVLYQVKEIPRKYLINPEGMIVLVNPSVEEVHDYLSNKIKSDGNY